MLVKKICKEVNKYKSANCVVCRREVIVSKDTKKKYVFCEVCSCIGDRVKDIMP